MGCAQSRVENEEAVARCKDRRQLMKEAVACRSAFASAHSSYVISLKNTGAAIIDFACPTPSFLPPPPTPNTSTSPSATTDATSATTTVTAGSPPPPALSAINATNSPFPPPPPPLPPDSPPSPLLPRSSTLPPRLNPNPSTNPDRHHPHVTPPPPPDSKGSSTWDYFFSLEDTMSLPTLVEEGDPAAAAAEDGVGKDEVEEDKAGEAGMLRHAKSAGEVDVKTAAAEREVSKKAEVSSGNGPSLAQVLVKLDDHFLKASEAAQEVSKLLEATRMHYHSNFADSRGHIDHSARVMRVITWNRSFKGMPNDDERDDFDSEKWETHASVLDKLLAWEKKLYDEVKTGELMKIEYQRKVALLNRQKKRGANYETLEKTKAAVSHLHTRYIVDMQSMDSTVSEIQHLRDDQLYPKLAELVDGMAKMWESMHAHHEIQLGAVIDLRGVDISCTPKETSEEHYRKADQLRCIASDWHSQFEKLVNYQRDYIHALNGWLKLNLIPIESSLKEKVSSPPRVNQPPVQALVHAWNDQLEKLPDELAKSCIKSFSAVINTIMLNQQEELKQREKCEELKKEYFKKERAFSDWYHKYSTRKMGTEDGGRDQDESSHAKDPLSEKQFAIESLNKRVEEEEEVYRKLCKQVREKSVSSLKMHLPELFRAMSEFSLECWHMYKNLLAITQAQNRNHAA